MSIFSIFTEILSWIFIIGGAGFLIVGSIGVIRFPDFWSRLHAAAIIDSAATALFLLGMIMQSGLTLVTVKLALIGLFLFITGPTATHAVANAAFVSGSRPLGVEHPAEIKSAELVKAVANAPPKVEDGPSKH